MADDEFPARSCRYVSRRRPEQSTFERPICPQLSNAGSTGAGVSFVHTPRLQKLVRLWKPTRVWSAQPRFSCCCFCCFPSLPNPILALRLHHHRVSVESPASFLHETSTASTFYDLLSDLTLLPPDVRTRNLPIVGGSLLIPRIRSNVSHPA